MRKKELKIAEPELFDRYPGNYQKFKRQYGLYLCTNKESYPDSKEKIMFVLSYISGAVGRELHQQSSQTEGMGRLG